MNENQILKQAKDALDKAVDEARRNRSFLNSVGPAIVDMLRPILNKIADNSKTDGIEEAIKKIRVEINPEVKLPEMKIPEIRIPPVKVPKPEVTVHIPPIKIPKVEIPKIDLPNELEVSLKKDIDYKNPLPVILMDNKGLPYIAAGSGGSSGPRVNSIITQGGQDVSDETNKAIRATIVSGGGAGTQYNDSSTPDTSGGVLTLAGAYDGTGSVFSLRNGIGVSDKALRVVHATDVAASVSATQVGTWNIAAVTDITNSIKATLIDSTGVAYSGSNPLPIVGPVVVTSITNTTATALIDSTGVAYSGSNPLPIVGPVVVSSITNTTAVVGDIASYIADTESNPVKIGGIARTTNPSKASDGSRITHSFDAVGRSLIRPVQVRGLIQTAYVSLSTGTETTLLAGAASTFLDLVYVMATNSSDAAVTVDLRAATAAGIQTSIRVPANGTAGVSLSVPIPQDVAADTWTADLPDITGTTVTIGALFSKEV